MFVPFLFSMIGPIAHPSSGPYEQKAKAKTDGLAAPAGPTIESGKDALKRLSELLGRGYDAARMEREVASVMSAWAAALHEDEMRERLDEVREQLAAGVEAVEEQGSEIDGESKTATAACQRSLAAIRATHRAFERGAERMPL
jgi:hypothetical protein